MRSLKILKYEDLEKVNQYVGEEFIIDLEECNNDLRRRSIDFLAGLTYLNGRLEKINKEQFLVKGI